MKNSEMKLRESESPAKRRWLAALALLLAFGGSVAFAQDSVGPASQDAAAVEAPVPAAVESAVAEVETATAEVAQAVEAGVESAVAEVEVVAEEAVEAVEEAVAEVVGTQETTSDWLSALTDLVDKIDGYVWGIPMMSIIIFTGLLLTVMLGIRHLLNLKRAFYYMFTKSDGDGEVSSFGSLCTALSATIGTGNIVGVATAIGTGGPGALFWMEVAAFFGMATKYAEGLLAVKYREVGSDGRVLGGPFYYIEKGLGKGWKWLAIAFAVFGAVAGLMGIGTITQVQGITSAVQRVFDANFNPADPSTGLCLFGGVYSKSVVIGGAVVTLLTALVLIGGLKRIASVATIVVPFMAVFYVLTCALLIGCNFENIPHAIQIIFQGAFKPSAVTGGAIGTMFIAMQKGIARGIFSNEAGLGSAPIAAAAAKTKEPVQQGLICMTGTFIDTIVICTMTGLAIVSTGAWDPDLGLKGVDITIAAFSKGLPFSPTVSSYFLMISLAFFAFTTILGWDYYSEKCVEYLVGPEKRKVVYAYRLLWVLAVFIGPYLTVNVVWGTADVFNGLMAFPNLIALIILSPVVARTTTDYFRRLRRGEVET